MLISTELICNLIRNISDNELISDYFWWVTSRISVGYFTPTQEEINFTHPQLSTVMARLDFIRGIPGTARLTCGAHHHTFSPAPKPQLAWRPLKSTARRAPMCPSCLPRRIRVRSRSAPHVRLCRSAEWSIFSCGQKYSFLSQFQVFPLPIFDL